MQAIAVTNEDLLKPRAEWRANANRARRRNNAANGTLNATSDGGIDNRGMEREENGAKF